MDACEGVWRRLVDERRLPREDWCLLIAHAGPELKEEARALACAIARERFGKAVWYRGIVEFTNICRNDCLYCGLRRSNRSLRRYRLTHEEIVAACAGGHAAGMRTFVLQGGEDPALSDAWLTELLSELRTRFPDSAVTLSIGERSRESYERLFMAGASRYLLRHETADPTHYAHLHPPSQRFSRRMACLRDLREIGYQTGCGMMTGSPGQGAEQLACDMVFIQDFRPHMIGIGPFLPHHATPFAQERPGGAETTLFLLSLCRIVLPEVLLPATTALRTLLPDGCARGVLAGCNVVMPNITPETERPAYMLYDGKPVSGGVRETLANVDAELSRIGCGLVSGRGDHPLMKHEEGVRASRPADAARAGSLKSETALVAARAATRTVLAEGRPAGASALAERPYADRQQS